MTINIMMHCRDGIVMACDTLGSLEQSMLRPDSGMPLRDSTGKTILHPVTKEPVIDVKTMERHNVVINSFGFENKIFQLKDYPVGILISGIASIGPRTVGDFIDEFAYSLRPYEEVKTSFNLEETLVSLRDYLFRQYNEFFPSLKGSQTGPPLNLLVGGFSANNFHGEMWGISFPENNIARRNSPEKPFAMACGGQPDAIQRFIDGIEPATVQRMVTGFQDTIGNALTQTSKNTANHLLSELKKLGYDVPPLEKLPPPPPTQMEFQLPLHIARYNIPYNLMSLQDAVDFVTFLGYITFGRQRFVVGIPTVGGSFRIGIITRKNGFALLNEEIIKFRPFQL